MLLKLLGIYQPGHTLWLMHTLYSEKMQKSYGGQFLNLITYLGVISLPILSNMYGHVFSSKRMWLLNMVTLLL